MAHCPIAAAEALYALLETPDRNRVLDTLHPGALNEPGARAGVRARARDDPSAVLSPATSTPSTPGPTDYADLVCAAINALPPGVRQRSPHILGFVTEQPDVPDQVRERLGAEHFHKQGHEQAWVALRLDGPTPTVDGRTQPPHLIEVRRFHDGWRVCSWTSGAFPLRSARQCLWWM